MLAPVNFTTFKSIAPPDTVAAFNVVALSIEVTPPVKVSVPDNETPPLLPNVVAVPILAPPLNVMEDVSVGVVKVLAVTRPVKVAPVLPDALVIVSVPVVPRLNELPEIVLVPATSVRLLLFCAEVIAPKLIA